MVCFFVLWFLNFILDSSFSILDSKPIMQKKSLLETDISSQDRCMQAHSFLIQGINLADFSGNGGYVYVSPLDGFVVFIKLVSNYQTD